MMGPSEWIAIGAVCVTILGSAAAVVWRMARLDLSVRFLTDELHQFRSHVNDEHKEIWRAVNRRNREEDSE